MLSSEQLLKLKESTNKVPKFSLEGERKLCKVIRVYDGDTITVNCYHNNILNRWSVRLLGLDTPELRPRKNIENRDEEIRKARASRDYLKSLIMRSDQLIYLECGGFDKYGRLLGRIYLQDNSSVNDMMIGGGYAKEYDGGTKS